MFFCGAKTNFEVFLPICSKTAMFGHAKSQMFEVENIITHPDFVFKHPSHEHDVALVKIRTRISGFPISRVACLPEFDEDPVSGKVFKGNFF